MSKPELKNGLIGVVNTCITCCGRTETAEWLSSILSDLDAEPPKPTGEQLKGSCTVESSTCPDPQPALMICNHAGECKLDEAMCLGKKPHVKNSACSLPRCSQFPNRICVPWVEPVKESDELPKDMFPTRNPDGHTYCERLWCKFRMQKEKAKEPEPVKHCLNCAQRKPCLVIFAKESEDIWCCNWTPKQPEPAAPVKSCATCKHENEMRAEASCCNDCDGYSAWEPKAEPGLIGCKIIGGKGNELWIVDMPWGNSIALYKAVGRKDFAYIETEIGDKFLSMQAFDDPPIRAWFRK